MLSAGATRENTMIQAPYKVSRPEGAEKVPPIDGAALRKESWILGQCPDYYNTATKAAFRTPNYDPAQKSKDNKTARDLRYKVAGTNIKNESPGGATDPRLAF